MATAQFNATKKEMNASESRGNFFRRRRSTHRRSKSLSRENWDDVVFSDSISKFPAYERVVLRHPGFVRPIVLFGPVADLAREKLTKDFADKYTEPLQDGDDKSAKCRIVRLSNIRDIMDRGKHALLDITPNAVDRLNYAQFYPIVIFLKAENKHVIKSLRHGIPKSAHKSSKKLLEQCQKLDRIWSHVFSTTIVLSDGEGWYRKLRDAIDLQQSGAVWMSENKVCGLLLRGMVFCFCFVGSSRRDLSRLSNHKVSGINKHLSKNILTTIYSCPNYQQMSTFSHLTSPLHAIYHVVDHNLYLATPPNILVFLN